MNDKISLGTMSLDRNLFEGVTQWVNRNSEVSLSNGESMQAAPIPDIKAFAEQHGLLLGSSDLSGGVALNPDHVIAVAPRGDSFEVGLKSGKKEWLDGDSQEQNRFVAQWKQAVKDTIAVSDGTVAKSALAGVGNDPYNRNGSVLLTTGKSIKVGVIPDMDQFAAENALVRGRGRNFGSYGAMALNPTHIVATDVQGDLMQVKLSSGKEWLQGSPEDHSRFQSVVQAIRQGSETGALSTISNATVSEDQDAGGNPLSRVRDGGGGRGGRE